MRLHRYLKDNWFIGIAAFLFGGIFFLLLKGFRVNDELSIAFWLLYSMLWLVIITWDYYRKRKFFQKLFMHIEQIDKKYLVLETLEMPEFYEGELFYQALYEVNKSMCEHVKSYEISMNDFKEYLEMWVHEAKLPIASMQLMCHNNKDLLDGRFVKQLRRLDQYTEQVLYYVRSEHASQDYLIKEVQLDAVVKKVIMQNKDDLLERHIALHVQKVSMPVLTDRKWLEFILNQLISNAMKYTDLEKEEPVIEIYAEELEQECCLHIYDNGIGISDVDVPKVFQKSFTGQNGRTRAKSTGMGLYITKKLCENLGHAIRLESKEGEYTDVMITFPKHDFYKM